MIRVFDFSELTGSEKDVLYKLVNYGSQEDGDLPSKSGMRGLIGKGLAEKDYILLYSDKPNIVTAKGVQLLRKYESLKQQSTQQG